MNIIHTTFAFLSFDFVLLCCIFPNLQFTRFEKLFPVEVKEMQWERKREHLVCESGEWRAKKRENPKLIKLNSVNVTWISHYICSNTNELQRH